MEKDMEICLAPSMTKGRLITIINRDKSTLVNIFTNNDMPMALPSKKLFGSKKPFSPILAIITPLEMIKKSLACRV